MPLKVTYIETEDGHTIVEWWWPEDFAGRVTVIKGGKTLEELEESLPKVIDIPNSFVVCDFCNEDIKEFPCPVVWGTHALCQKCYESIQLK